MKVIQTRTVPVYPKNTRANTQYWDMAAEDRAYIMEWLIKFMANMCEVATREADIQRDWFRRRPGRWPKGQFGPNSDASMLGGIVDQLLKGNDPSTVHLDAIEQLMDTVSQMYSDDEAAVQSVKFDRKIFTIE
jgi:hypothetical protein